MRNPDGNDLGKKSFVGINLKSKHISKNNKFDFNSYGTSNNIDFKSNTFKA